MTSQPGLGWSPACWIFAQSWTEFGSTGLGDPFCHLLDICSKLAGSDPVRRHFARQTMESGLGSTPSMRFELVEIKALVAHRALMLSQVMCWGRKVSQAGQKIGSYQDTWGCVRGVFAPLFSNLIFYKAVVLSCANWLVLMRNLILTLC